MAKKKPVVKEPESPFITEKTDWGVQVKLYPFRGINNPGGIDAMVMTADVERPKKDRKAVIRYWFCGVTGKANLSPTEISMWSMAQRSLIAEAQRVGDTLRPSRAK